MEIERVLAANGRVEMWTYEWDISQKPARKTNRKFVGYEQPVHSAQQQAAVVREAICWSYGRTLGNITVSNEDLLGKFPGKEGDDAQLACDIVAAGKMRNGKDRWWCRTHQTHWGRIADIEEAAQSGRCDVLLTPSRCRMSSNHTISRYKTTPKSASGAQCHQL